MVLDYYFAFLVIAHEFSLSRQQHSKALIIEDVFRQYLEMTRSNAEVALVWVMKIRRLMA